MNDIRIIRFIITRYIHFISAEKLQLFYALIYLFDFNIILTLRKVKNSIGITSQHKMYRACSTKLILFIILDISSIHSSKLIKIKNEINNSVVLLWRHRKNEIEFIISYVNCIFHPALI